MTLRIHHIPDCAPRLAGAVTELSRVAQLSEPTLVTVQTNKPWVLLYNNQLIEERIDTAKKKGRNIEIVRLWADNPYLESTVCPLGGIAWCLSTPAEFMRKRDIYHHTTTATVEALRKHGINAFMRSEGFPAVEIKGLDCLMSAPPAIVRHGEWFSTFCILWWDVLKSDLEVVKQLPSSRCIRGTQFNALGYAGIRSINPYLSQVDWLETFGEVVARRLGLKAVCAPMKAATETALLELYYKLDRPEWVESGIHPGIKS
jgi:hypothetical protein